MNKKDPPDPVSILIAEDNPDHREILKRGILSSLKDCSIDEIASGDTCIKRLTEKRYDALVLDYSLPKKNGLEVLEWMKGKGLDIPTIMVTGLGDEKIAGEAVNLGAEGYVIKEEKYGERIAIHLSHIVEIQNLRKRVEKAKEYTEKIVSSMIDALIVLDPDGNIQKINKAASNLLGYEEKGLLGQPVGIIFAEEEEEEEEEEERALYDKKFKGILRKGPIIDYDASFKTEKGENIPVSLSGSVMRSEKGKLVGVVLTARDMRVKIAAETALKESEERFRGVVENLTDAIFLLDEKGRFVHMNRPGLDLNGRTKVEDIVGKSFMAGVHKRYANVLTKAFDRAWSGKAIDCQYESTTPKGIHKWWNCTLLPFRDASEKIVNIIGISRDITEHRKAERLIKFFREYAENIVANLPVSILVVNRNLEISFVNQHFLKKMGKAKEKVIGKGLDTALGKGIVQNLGLDEKIKQVIRGEKELHGRFELRSRTFDYRILPIKEKVGRRKNAMLIMEDVTARVQLEHQLRQSERLSAIGQFTASVAHEINNPLSIILGNIQYLLSNVDQIDFSGVRERKGLVETLGVIEGEACRCGEIVTNLLHFSHRGKAEKGEVAINKIVRRTLRMMEHQLKLAKIKLFVELGKDIPSIGGDANLLQQVFVNLILNAQQVMSRGGKLYVTTSMEDSEWVSISFRDTGPGIPMKHLHRIFEPFFTTKDKGKGTGLGLSVVHSIVEEHGGNIRVRSKKGIGATFTVRLPVPKKKGLFGLWG